MTQQQVTWLNVPVCPGKTHPVLDHLLIILTPSFLLSTNVSILVQFIISFLCISDTVSIITMSANLNMIVFDLLTFLPEDYKLFVQLIRRASFSMDFISPAFNTEIAVQIVRNACIK